MPSDQHIPAPGRLITTRFDATSTAQDVVAGVDLCGLRAAVTGASSGIGIETARALAAAGADVVLAVRNVAAGRRVADDIAATTGSTAVDVRPLDLSERRSIDGRGASALGRVGRSSLALSDTQRSRIAPCDSS